MPRKKKSTPDDTYLTELNKRLMADKSLSMSEALRMLKEEILRSEEEDYDTSQIEPELGISLDEFNRRANGKFFCADGTEWKPTTRRKRKN